MPSMVITIRVPAEMRARLDTLCERVHQDRRLLTGAIVRRSDVARLALVDGIEALEQFYGLSTQAPTLTERGTAATPRWERGRKKRR